MWRLPDGYGNIGTMKNFDLPFFESAPLAADSRVVSAHLCRHFLSIDWKLTFVGEYIDALRMGESFHG